MRIATGKVVDGRVVVEGAALDEGATVTVIAREDDESFVLSPDEEAELLEAIGEAERGEVIGGDELLKRLRRGSCLPMQ
jgi:hypothetical protein